MADAARHRAINVGLRINPRDQGPHNVIHAVNIDIVVHRDSKAHALVTTHYGGQEVALPTFFYTVTLFYLYNATAPVGKTIRNVDILDNTWLKPFTKFINGAFPNGGIYIVVIQHMDKEWALTPVCASRPQ